MRNKFRLTRIQNVNLVNEKIVDYVYNALILARYEIEYDEVAPLLENNKRDNEVAIAADNFKNTFYHILNNPDEKADADFLLELHDMLMKDLNVGVKAELSEEQKEELAEMINQPAKSNTEIAISAMLFLLEKHLFSDGDVRISIMFANKIMIDHGCGVITVSEYNKEKFRELLKEFHQTRDYKKFKQWIFSKCISGMRVEY
ncbi:MAG: hypothetical protein QM204_02420 [Bacillota bacterium]|jgi:uncharacterized protein YbgA (DUF1722 family)|nr:hypothetical protein [Bacillota bacterium]NLL25822.1 Fic family protein [Erysipelotrichia bacterium]